jgi:hypothetical protein
MIIITGCLTLGAGPQAESPLVSSGGEPPAMTPARREAQLQRRTAETAFHDAFPGVGLYKRGVNTTRVFGRAFSSGSSALESAETFRKSHARMFGVAVTDLRPGSLLRDARHIQPVMFLPDTGDYKFTMVCYRQFLDDLPVFNSDLRVLVRNEPGYKAVLASSTLRDLGGLTIGAAIRQNVALPAFIQQRYALARQEVLKAHPTLVNFSPPETVVWAGEGEENVEPRAAVQFIGDNFAPNGQSDEKWLFLVDAASSEILHEEFKLYRVDGNAGGNVTEGIGADFCENEVSTALPHLRITSGANSTFTDANGDYTITAGGGTVDATLADGQWFDVFDFVTSVESLSLPASTPANFAFNASNTDEFIRAQSNGFRGANVVRDFVVQFNPSYPTFTDTDIPCWVNRTDGFCPGNAWYDPADFGSPTGYSINFCQAGGGFPNTAWTSVIYHEFGHHLVAAAGSGQGQYGEGTGDCMSVIILDDPHVGLGFFGTCNDAGTLRSADNVLQYPCSSEAHACAPLLAGCIWDTRNELVITEPVEYQNILGDLMVNSILLHTGSTITPQITIDWLTLDDDDANLANGTPHYPEICTGFGAHNMDCPPLSVGLSVSPATDFDSAGDVGGPFLPDNKVYTVENLGPGGINYDVTTATPWLTITNGTGSLPTVGSTALVTVTINASATSLPQGTHVGTVDFTNTTDGVGNTQRSVTLSIGVPEDCVNAMAVCPGSISDTTVGRSPDGSSTCGTSDTTPDLWYRYTPDSSGTATFSLCSGTNYDSVMSIHSGCPGTTVNELACDDDGCSAGGPSTITLAVTAATQYLIRVTGWNGSTGNFTLTITGPNCAPTLLSISYPGGLPQFMEPAVATNFDVRIQDGDETYQSGTATLHYRYDGGAFQTAALAPLGGDLFQATLPAALCTDSPEFYVSAQGDLGSTVTSPVGAPTTFFSTAVGTSTVIMADDFETDQGWVANNLGATSGDWQRGVPVNDPGWAYDPASDSDGSGQCYLTQNVTGNTDVDGGEVELVSPAIDMSTGDITISYDYYLFLTNTTGGADRLLVELSSNGDAGPWTEIARHDTDGGLNWRSNTITQAELDAAGVTMSANMKLRFNTNDAATQSINESGLDAFLVTSFVCAAVPCPAADGDLSLDGDTNGVDIQYFIDGVINGATPDEECHGNFDGLNGLDFGDMDGMVNALLTAP